MAKKVKTIKEVLGVKEDSWAQYSVKDLVPKWMVRRFDDKQGNRFYYFLNDKQEITIAMGVTSAFGIVSTERDSIDRWKDSNTNWRQLLNASAEYGTLEHLLHGDIMLGKGVNRGYLEAMKKIAIDNGQSGDMPVKDTLAFLRFVEDHQLTPLLIEAQLVWEDSNTGECLAMTIDLLAKLTIKKTIKETVQDGVYLKGDKKGEPKMVEQKREITEEQIVLIDFKSNFFEKEKKSFYETHKMQLIAGAKAVKQNFDIMVDGIYNYSPNAWRTNPSYTIHKHDLSERDDNIFYAYWNLIVSKEINRPKGNILVCENFKDSNDYKLLSYQEYAEQVLKPQPIEK